MLKVWACNSFAKRLLSSRFEEPLSDYVLEDEEADLTQSPRKFLLPTQEDITENQSTFKPSTWRLGVARQEDARDSERYLHRILH